MKILFISNMLHHLNTEPLGIMYLSAALKKAGHETRYCHVEDKEIKESLKCFQPDILAYSITSGYHQYFLKLNQTIRKEYKKGFSFFGGPHATFFPEMIQEDSVDGVSLGEAEESFVSLLDKLANGIEEINESVSNWWLKINGKILKGTIAAAPQQLDNLKWPDRELIYRYDFAASAPIKRFIAHRGCPYDCSYCFNHALKKLYKGKGSLVRSRSVEDVIGEVAHVQSKYGIRFVTFADDNFIQNRNWLSKFAELYPKVVGIPFHCSARPDLIDEEVVENLSRAYCQTCFLAIETGSDACRKKILKRKIGQEQLVNACQLLRAAKIKIYTQNMVGLPFETVTEAIKTIKLNIRCRPDYAWASIYYPYPRTELGDYAKAQGLYDGNIDNIQPSYYSYSILKNPQRKQLDRIHKLFSLAVEFPIIIKFLPLLVKLPLYTLYKFTSILWKGYCYRKRIYPVKLTIQETIFNISRFFKAVS